MTFLVLKNEESNDWINLDNCYMNEFENSKVNRSTLKIKLSNYEDTKIFDSEQLKGVILKIISLNYKFYNNESSEINDISRHIR